MNTHWNNHCGGFSYSLVYVSGRFSTVSNAVLDEIFTFSGTKVTIKPDLSWVGTHILKIRGHNGKYNYIDSDAFSVEIIHPCTISVFTAFEL